MTFVAEFLFGYAGGLGAADGVPGGVAGLGVVGGGVVGADFGVPGAVVREAGGFVAAGAAGAGLAPRLIRFASSGYAPSVPAGS